MVLIWRINLSIRIEAALFFIYQLYTVYVLYMNNRNYQGELFLRIFLLCAGRYHETKYQADETTVLLAVNWYSLWNFEMLNAIFYEKSAHSDIICLWTISLFNSNLNQFLIKAEFSI